MYSVGNYGRMMADEGRMQPYVQALREAMRPGMTVADIGAGTGIFSFLACQLGASRVYAIEPSDSIGVARQIAAAQGWADRVVFIERASTEITLPEPVDLVIADLRGVLPLFGRNLHSLADARTRLLRSDGVLIPLRDTVRTAVVEAPETYAHETASWTENPAGIAMPEGLRVVTNSWVRGNFAAAQMLTAAATCFSVEYGAVPVREAFEAPMELVARRSGLAHGLAVWFDANLAPGIGLSNAPGERLKVYGQAFFPWSRPVTLNEGERIEVTLGARFVSGEWDWYWNTTLPGGERFTQATWLGRPFSFEKLRKRDSRFRPARNREAEIDRFILQSMDGSLELEQIARALQERFPQRFNGLEDALSRVGALSEVYAG